MAQKQAPIPKPPPRIIVNARIDPRDVERLDAMARVPGSFQYQRTRSELVAFAVHEYVERAERSKKESAKLSRKA